MNAALFQDPLAHTPAPQQTRDTAAHAPALIFTAPTGSIDDEVRATITRKARHLHATETSTYSPSKPAATAKADIAAELAAALTGAKPLRAR